MLIDTHCHIYDEQFRTDIFEVIQRAEDAGVEKIICVSVDLPSAEQCMTLAEKFPSVYASVGIHPHEAKEAPRRYLAELENFISHPKVVALGEMGLDYHYNFSPPDVQIRLYREQLEFAQSVELPVVVHNRKSDEDLIRETAASGNRYGVVHSFTGTPEMAEKILELGFLISFTGMVTFKKPDLSPAVKAVPDHRFMVETDAPYLAPVPYRGRRNEPARVIHVAEKIAEIRDATPEDIISQTTETALNFFKKLSP